MATLNISLKPPEQFDFKNPDEWPKWKRRFEQYLAASSLDSEENIRKISTLLYCMGEEGDFVLTSTNIIEDERKLYSNVMRKFDEFFLNQEECDQRASKI